MRDTLGESVILCSPSFPHNHSIVNFDVCACILTISFQHGWLPPVLITNLTPDVLNCTFRRKCTHGSPSLSSFPHLPSWDEFHSLVQYPSQQTSNDFEGSGDGLFFNFPVTVNTLGRSLLILLLYRHHCEEYSAHRRYSEFWMSKKKMNTRKMNWYE